MSESGTLLENLKGRHVVLPSRGIVDQPWTRVSAGRVTLEIVAIALIAVVAGLWVRGNLPEVARTSLCSLPTKCSMRIRV